MVSQSRRKYFGPAFAALAVGLVLSALAPAQPAVAQGLFDALFGGFDRAMRREMSPRVSAYSDTGYDDRRDRRSGHAGPSSGFCVRTCDGRFFPVRSSGNMSAAELCKSFCPAATTKIFSGSKIDHAVAPGGQRYADLDNAFLYRERTVENCSCNGKDAYGLVTLDVAADPTLRAGDIIATNEGLATYNGNRKSAAAGEFTPIAESGGSSEWRLRLMSIKVTPAPARAEPPEPVVEKISERTDRRRAQR